MTYETNNSNVVLLLGRIDGKLDSALSRIDQHEDTLEKYNERITKLETGKAWMLGYAAAVSGAIGLALQFLFKG